MKAFIKKSFKYIKNIISEVDLKIKSNNKVKKMIMALFAITLLVFVYVNINYSAIATINKTQKNVEDKLKNMELVVGGEAVGIKLLATGVLVMSVDREDISDILVGDIILNVNGNKVETNEELANYAKLSNGNNLKLELDRKGVKFQTEITPIKEELSQEYKLGLWVKDSSAGVGTITFYDRKNMNFAALGHAVTETRENYILPIESGGITKTKIFGITAGVPKLPGELKGTLTNELVGEILGNTNKGIYGNILSNTNISNKKSVKISSKSQIREGAASIYCTLDDNEVKAYSIMIEKVLLTSTGNKNMIIKVTDEKLKEKTGGIVQGMSGSPIMQDGKLIGAVTHVFLNDPLRGYGVFIENMIEDLSEICK